MTNITPAGSMTHEDAYAELGALSLGALSGEEEPAVLAHVADCRLCSDELRRLREVIALMPQMQSAGMMSPERSAGLRARLIERAQAARPASRRAPIANWLAIAASAAFVAAAAGYFRAAGERDRLRVASASSDSLIARLSAVALDREAQLTMMTGPGVHVMDLAATGIRAPTARMFWDPATSKWAMFAHGLSMPAKGRAYELWLVTKDRKIPAGMFVPRGDGSAVIHASYAMTPADLKAIAVTEEPEAGVTVPTGPIVLVGASGT
jgi:anti-sigma-K factor RskA